MRDRSSARQTLYDTVRVFYTQRGRPKRIYHCILEFCGARGGTLIIPLMIFNLLQYYNIEIYTFFVPNTYVFCTKKFGLFKRRYLKNLSRRIKNQVMMGKGNYQTALA